MNTTIQEKHGTDYRTLFDRDYLGHFDLQGAELIVTINRVVGGTLTAQGGKKSKKPICYFDGKEKGLICNKTNSKTIAGMYGNFTEGWLGKKITLYASTTEVGGETVECIRVRNKVPSVPAPVTRPKVAQEQIDALHTALSKNNVELPALLAKAELTDLAEMAAEDAPKAIRWVEAQGKKK